MMTKRIRKSQQMQPITVSFGWQAEGQPEPAQTFASMDALAAAIEEHSTSTPRRDKYKTNADIYAAVKNNGRWLMHGTNAGDRQKESFSLVDFVHLDIDKAPAGSYQRVMQLPGAYVMYESTGNQLPLKNGLECFRVIVPLLSAVNAATLLRCTAWLGEKVAQLGDFDFACVDRASGDINRIMYMPFAHGAINDQEGAPLNPLAIPADYVAPWELSESGLSAGDGAACWEHFDELYQLLTSIDGVSIDKVGHIRMPSQSGREFSNGRNANDAWKFMAPRGEFNEITFKSQHELAEPGWKARDAFRCIPGAMQAFENGLAARRKAATGTALVNFSAKGRAVEPDDLQYLPQTVELLAQVERKLFGFCGWEGSAADFGVNCDAIDYVLRNVGASRSKASGSLFYMSKHGKLASQTRQDMPIMLKDLGIDWLCRPTREGLDAVQEGRELKLSKEVAALALAEDEESQAKYKAAVERAASSSAAGFSKTLDEMLSETLQAAPNQFTTLRREIDMFAEDASVWIDGEGTMVASQPHQPFASGPFDQRHIDDYLIHFPEANEFLQWVAASRFASSRKTAYTWLHAPSDWGKGFLMAAFKRIGAVIEFDASELTTLLKGANTGKTDGDFIRAWLCVVNECREIVPEMRKMENSVGLNTKYALSTEVPLYAKVFTSADGVNGLNGEHGADEQLCNRFNYLEGNGQIKTRPLFAEETGAYNDSLFHWVAMRLNELVEYYRNMGRKAAADTANAFLRDFHSRHGLAEAFGVMGDSYVDVRRDFIKWVHEQLADNASRYYEEHTSRCTRTDKGIVLRSVKKTFDEFLQTHYAASDVVWMGKDWKTITGVSDKMERFPGLAQPCKGLLMKS